MSKPGQIRPQVVEKIGQIVRDRGDVELLVALDRLVDHANETEQAAALAAVITLIQQNRQRS
jgi:hypothetical protein